MSHVFHWPAVRVLVTGGSGFLGSHVVEKLKERGALPFAPKSGEYDLVQGPDVRKMLRDLAPDVVFHLAARVGGIGANQDNPGRFFYENAMMGVQLVHESFVAGVKKLVATGTICAYPKHAPVPFRESDIWNGYPEETNAPYGIAKKILSVQSAAYREQYRFNSVVVYPVNLYGPRDNFNLSTSHVIPAMLRKFHAAKQVGAESVELWGDGSATREFFYVEDCAEAVVRAAESYNSSEPLNLGSGEEISVQELAEKVRTLVGYDGAIRWDATRPNGQPRRRLDVSRARDLLGFEARVGLDDGLRRTYEWMLSHGSA